MHRIRLPLLLLAVIVIAGGRGAEPPAAAKPEQTGLAVGMKAPSFTLKDQQGKDVSLDSLRKQGPVAVVFHRSADW